MQQSPAEAAAAGLHALLQEPDIKQLLQRPLPAATAQLTGLLEQVLALKHALEKEFQTVAAAASGTGRMVGGLLRRQAAHDVAILLAWTQQQPQHPELAQLQHDISAPAKLAASDCCCAVGIQCHLPYTVG
jgi:hypothetical protein